MRDRFGSHYAKAWKSRRQKPGKVVIVSQHYQPDRSTTAAIMAAIANHLALETPVLVLSGAMASYSELIQKPLRERS
jgi:hypothetical protein